MELKKRIKHGWDISAPGYSDLIKDDLIPERIEPWRNTILENAPDKEHLKILDIGCGPGFFSIILSEACHDVTGIDLSAEMIKEAKANAAAYGVNPEFLQMDSQRPEFPENTFDLIINRNVVWTLSEPKEAYISWYRILKQGGRLLVFDGDHLKDLRDPVGNKEYAHNSYMKEYEDVYGHPPKVSFTKETFEEARGWRTDLPLADKKRPEWDEMTLEEIGYNDVSTEYVNEKVFADERDIWLHRNNPYFLVKGEK